MPDAEALAAIQEINARLDALEGHKRKHKRMSLWERIPTKLGRTIWQCQQGTATATITRGGRFSRVSVGTATVVWFKADYPATFSIHDLKQIATAILEQQ